MRVRRNRESWWTTQRLNRRDSSVGLRKKIYCTGPIVTFSHGWPLNADAWGGQMQRARCLLDAR
jgi:non-heme chloroperoxidase